MVSSYCGHLGLPAVGLVPSVPCLLLWFACEMLPAPHRLMCWNTWSTAGGSVWGRLWNGWEVGPSCRQPVTGGQALRFIVQPCFLSYLCLLRYNPQTASVSMPLLPSWVAPSNQRQNKSSLHPSSCFGQVFCQSIERNKNGTLRGVERAGHPSPCPGSVPLGRTHRGANV